MEAKKPVRHFEKEVIIGAPPSDVFAFIDDPGRFSTHMAKSSWMLGGGRMETTFDDGGGKVVGSHIKMTGTFFRLRLALDEVITVYDPPQRKAWQTVGEVRLIVIGGYCMNAETETAKPGSLLRISIDYDLPARKRWLGRIFGGWYAKWCVNQMCDGVQRHFGRPLR